MTGRSVTAALAVWLLMTMPARAGLYNTEEPQLGLVFGDFRRYYEALGNYQSYVAKELESREGSMRYRALRRVEELEKKQRAGELTYEERVNLSAYYVRLNRPEEAIRLLEAVPREQRDFLVWSNLATANQMAGQFEPAARYLREALAGWPKVSLWCPSWQLNWLRLAEQYQLKMIELRQREVQGRGAPETIDALFRVRFIGPSGEYEPGLLAADQWANMPADAVTIVKQLVLWLPHDARLKWLLAELLNAGADLEAALKLMDEIDNFNSSFRPRELVVHHRALREAKKISDAVTLRRNRLMEETVKHPLALLGGLLPSGPGIVLDTLVSMQAIEKVKNEPAPPLDLGVSPALGNPPDNPAPAWQPEWRQIAVSFVAGAVIAILLSLQFREMRRRKQQGVETAPPER
jgi:tetratricopeptide (TPR) repeat protein